MNLISKLNRKLYPKVLKLRPLNLRLYWTSMKLLSFLNQCFSVKGAGAESFVYIHMAVYNGEDFIAQTIQSVIDQKHQNWRLEIINDGSTDSTTKIISQFTDRRINCVHLKTNHGLWNARNIGRTHAIANDNWVYFTTIDADDFACSHWLSNNLELMALSSAFAIRPINRRIDKRGEFLFDYPACDQTFWSRRAIVQLGLMETQQGANDSRYMRTAETIAVRDDEFILLSLRANQSMRVHERNHSNITH